MAGIKVFYRILFAQAQLTISENISLDIIHQIRIGDPAVHVLPDSTTQRTHATLATSAIVVCQNTLLRLSFSGTDTPRPSQHRIWTPRWESINAPQGPIYAIGQFESWVESPDSHSVAKVLCYIDDRAIRLVAVDASKSDNPIPQQVQLNGTPSRIIYSTYLNKLIVGFARTIVASQVPNHDTASGPLPRLIFPMLKVVDPNAPESQIHAILDEQHIKQEEADGIDKDGGLEPDTTVAGNSGERILALQEWMPKLNDQQWPLLVVGSERSLVVENESTTDGKLIRVGALSVYSLKPALPKGPRAKLELKKRFRKESPVYAIATIGESSLVCGHGHSLEILQLIESSNNFNLSVVASVQLRADVRALSTANDQIFVSTSHDSHCIYHWGTDGLKLVGNEDKARNGLAHIFLKDSNLLLGSDLDSGVCGLQAPAVTTNGSHLELAFETNLLSTILRFRLASPRRPKASECPNKNDIIIGAALNGSFHTFDILPYEHGQLLHYIQVLAQQDPTICPATYFYTSTHNGHFEGGPSGKHVDGNILARLLDRPPSGAEYLRHLVGNSEDMFLRLTSQAFSDVPPYNAYERVVGYLEGMLRPVQ